MKNKLNMIMGTGVAYATIGMTSVFAAFQFEGEGAGKGQVREQLNEALKEQKIMEKLKEKEFERYLVEIDVNESKVSEEIVNYINYKGREE